METFIFSEDGQETSRCGRAQALKANAYDKPILRLIMGLLEQDMPCEASHSDKRNGENQRRTGRTDDYMYTIQRLDLPAEEAAERVS